METALSLTPYVGEGISGADVQMRFIGEFADAQGMLQNCTSLAA
jgi:glutathione S-transferase